MKTKLYNAKVLNKDMSITDGGLCVKDNIIKCVFEGDKCDNGEECTFDREIDCGGNMLVPGFKNAHAHSAMTFLRSRADDLPLLEWLEKQVFPQEDKLTAEHIHWFTKLAILEYLSGGTTAAFDMYFEPEAIVTAAKDMGFRMTLCGAANNFGTKPEKMAGFYEKYRNRNTGEELIDYKLGFHAEYTNSMDSLKEIADILEQYKTPIYTHMSETKAEHDGCYERHGKSPAALFAELGLWNYGGGVFHAVHADDNDIALMKKHDIWAVSNPGSNLKLASGIAPLMKMRDAGVKIALGTDGAASNNALSMFREMYFAATLQKHLLNDAAACPAYNALEWTFSNSALAMGLTDCDCLESGKKADIVMLNLARPSMRPYNNIVKNIVYSGDTSIVKMTMVNGKILYQDGEFLTGEKAETIYSKTQELMKDFD